MFYSFSGVFELLARDMEVAIEEPISYIDKKLVKALKEIQKERRNDERQDPSGKAKAFLNTGELFMKLGDGDADGQAECGENRAAAEGNGDADDAALPDGLRREIGKDAAWQI